MRAWCALVVVVTRGVAAQDDLESGSGSGSGDDASDYAALYDDANPEWGNAPEQPDAEAQGQIGSGLYGGEAVFNHHSVKDDLISTVDLRVVATDLVYGWKNSTDGQSFTIVKWSIQGSNSYPSSADSSAEQWTINDMHVEINEEPTSTFIQNNVATSPSGYIVVYTNARVTGDATQVSCKRSCEVLKSSISAQNNYTFVDKDFNIVHSQDSCQIVSCQTQSAQPKNLVAIIKDTGDVLVRFQDDGVCKCACESGAANALCVHSVTIDPGTNITTVSADGKSIVLSDNTLLNLDENTTVQLPSTTGKQYHSDGYVITNLVDRNGAHFYNTQTGKECVATFAAETDRITDFRVENDVFVLVRNNSNIAVEPVQDVLLKNRDACAQLLPSPPPPPQKTETSSAAGVVSSCAILVLARLLV